MTPVKQTAAVNARRRLREFFVEHADEIGKLRPSQQNDLANIVYLEGKRSGRKYLDTLARTRAEASRKGNVTRAEKRLVRLLTTNQTLRPVNEKELLKNFNRFQDEGELMTKLRSHKDDYLIVQQIRFEASERSRHNEAYGAFYHWS